MKITPVILCGGAGTRLWAQSEKNLPKQFVDWGGWTLFSKTLDRLKSPIFDYPIITTNLAYLKLVIKHLKLHKIKKYKIILEPYKKNTASAILTAALIKDLNNYKPMIFISSDNIVGKIKKFNNSINEHKKYLNENNVFIFGIKPVSPSSEYGYFLTKRTEKKLNKVYRFIEKPKKNKLRLIIKKKAYMNSGMFYMRKDSIINNFKRYQNKIFINCSNSINKAKKVKNIYYLDKSNFKRNKDISFDYAILEKSKNINGIKLDIPLTDLGNWKEIWKFFKKSYTKKYLKENTFYRPWGKYINLFKGNGFLLKELIINPKSSISLQKHLYRSEKWTIISGKPRITIDKKKFYKGSNESIFIPKNSVHRIENLYNEPVQIVEAQTGHILKESDIVRYKDIYGRVN